jgi:hypothetical protein
MAALYKSEAPEEVTEDKTKGTSSMVSRSDLSRTRPIGDLRKLAEDKTIHFGNKGFFGTPLPLIPDIRKSVVDKGVVSMLLETFGIIKRFDRRVTLIKGPNKKANRYLIKQYKRLIKSIDGKLIPGDINSPASVV